MFQSQINYVNTLAVILVFITGLYLLMPFKVVALKSSYAHLTNEPETHHYLADTPAESTTTESQLLEVEGYLNGQEDAPSNSAVNKVDLQDVQTESTENWRTSSWFLYFAFPAIVLVLGLVAWFIFKKLTNK